MKTLRVREPILSEASVFHVRKQARLLALRLGWDAVSAAELETAVSEIAQNVWRHAGGGTVEVAPVRRGHRIGLHVVASDDGPGIADVERALQGSYSTIGTLGVGLSACTRLMDSVEIDSVPGQGTRVSLWKVPGNAPPETSAEPTYTDYDDLGEIVEGQISPFGSLEWARGARVAKGSLGSGDRGLVKATTRGELLAVADGVGSGSPAAHAAELALACAARHCDRDPTLILAACHEALKGTVGAALTVASIDASTSVVSWAGIGNVGAVVWRANRKHADAQLVSRSGTLGLRAPSPRSTTLVLEPDDAIVVWTDGIRSSAVRSVDRRARVGEVAHDILMLGADGRDDALVLVARYHGGTIW